jgi:hypothetical protein
VDPLNAKTTGPENTAGDLVAPNGKVWRVTEHTRNGAALYVIDGVDPAKCPRLVMSTRMELEEIFGAELLPLDGAA